VFKIQAMSYFSDNLRDRIERSALSQGKIADAIGELRANFNQVVAGKRSLSEEKMQKLATLSEVDVTFEELKYWRYMDELAVLKEKYPEFYEEMRTEAYKRAGKEKL
jgi:transcriptional regulator with XRE-family HTH domain